MALVSGAKLGPYEIRSSLGAGGMGEVYRAHDSRLQRDIAIKVLPASLASDPLLSQRLEHEAKAVSRLSHPHTCTLHDIGHQDGMIFLVMELVEGETLEQRLSKGPLSPEQTIRYGTQIADALSKVHKLGFTHRDLKPSDIMLTKADAKLMDFGLAKPSGTAPLSSRSARDDRRTIEADRRWHAGGHISVHGTGTAGREGRRSADGHLCPRRSALRNGDRKASFQRQEPRKPHRVHSGFGTSSDY